MRKAREDETVSLSLASRDWIYCYSCAYNDWMIDKMLERGSSVNMDV